MKTIIFLSSFLLLSLLSCKENKQPIENPILRAKIDSAWITTDFRTNPDLCANMDLYYTIMENIEQRGFPEEDVIALDSISDILKQEFKME